MSPVVITLIAVFVGTASLCAGVGLSVLGKHREHPLDRLAKLNRRMPGPEQSAQVLKQEMWAESAAELAELWKLNETTIRRVFQDEPGVLKIGKSKRRDGKRCYVTLRIPESVALRVYQERSR